MPLKNLKSRYCRAVFLSRGSRRKSIYLQLRLFAEVSAVWLQDWGPVSLLAVTGGLTETLHSPWLIISFFHLQSGQKWVCFFSYFECSPPNTPFSHTFCLLVFHYSESMCLYFYLIIQIFYFKTITTIVLAKSLLPCKLTCSLGPGIKV